MAVYKETRREKIKRIWMRYSKFTKAAFFLMLAFFIIGACTIGNYNGAGRSQYLQEDSSVVFYLDQSSDDVLEEVYINVGAAYVEPGKTYSLTLKSSTLTSSTSSVTWSSSYGLGTVRLANVFDSGTTSVGTNFTWIQVRDTSKTWGTSRKLIELTVSCDLLLNEVVFVSESGAVIDAYVTSDDVQEICSDNSYSWSVVRDLGFKNQDDEYKTLLDAQTHYTTGSTTYSNFTQEEIYTLIQIENILDLGAQILSDGSEANVDSDFGPLAVLFLLAGTIVFGRGTFGLRMVPLLFTSALIFLIYLFMRDLYGRKGGTRNEFFAFLTACLFACGGLALTVGRLGLYYSMEAFMALASYYFMYRFFSRGVSSEKPLKSACNILVSGIFFALAVAVDPKMLVACLGVIGLFVAGVVRAELKYRQSVRELRTETNKQNAEMASRDEMHANTVSRKKKERIMAADMSYKRRAMYLLFLVTFLVGTALIYLLSSVPSYFMYQREYGTDSSILYFLKETFTGAFTITNETAYSSGNTMNVFLWLFAAKGATLYENSTTSLYIGMNAQLNIAMALTAFVGFVFLTCYAILYAVTGRQDGPYGTKYSADIVRIYVVLTAGLVSSFLAYLFAGDVSAVQGFLFDIFYLAFIPLTFYSLYVHDTTKRRRLFGKIRMNTISWVMFAVLIVYAVIFLLSLPMVFCIPVATLAAAICFGWTSILNNGYYR